MTVSEFEKLAIGLDTGYTDRNGTPIKVGDRICYYKRCTTAIADDDDIESYPKWQVCGQGHRGWVYTGKILRKHHTVTFSFESGYEIVPNAYAYKYETDESGNLILILVLKDGEEAPRLGLKELMRGEDDDQRTGD